MPRHPGRIIIIIIILFCLSCSIVSRTFSSQIHCFNAFYDVAAMLTPFFFLMLLAPPAPSYLFHTQKHRRTCFATVTSSCLFIFIVTSNLVRFPPTLPKSPSTMALANS
uniref:Uncharacterized protein n=1 Tax=Trypanosoma vivax (strain Y486) TaxID=1055687 RepID=G0U982_TRYVY|nr:hypothetical protein TVY486_1116500 [Trypanosoma vivax Y486]